MDLDIGFFFVLLSQGVLIGMMYALIALGFVLVYKATDAINFAQGEFVMMAGFLAGVVAAATVSFWLGVLVAIVGMIVFSFVLERAVLRPLLGRPVVAVIMATIGLAAVLRGIFPMLFGTDTYSVNLPVGDESLDFFGIGIQPVHLAGGLVSLALFGVFTWFFRKSRMGVAMRAVADNQQVAMAMGINVQRYFAFAWAMAGIVSAMGGVMWGGMLGVDVHLALIGLKVFPVVILGGLDSIGGAIVGGIIIGVVESLTAGYIDASTKDFAPYVLMIVVLMVRPYGIFGKRKIERV